ncbi:STAS domain-containing protein [Streptomyces sp. NPDC058289]|uniref:STAS domain-containing protein n=1 Tax=Streptomyces sp. NPDC058289 TaxID=3346425 RepID=UPI0036E2EFBA
MEPTVTVLPDHGGVRVVRCSGEFDADTEDALQMACATAVAAPEVTQLVLDVRDVTFADSSFLNLLLVTHRDSDLRLRGPVPNQLARLLEMTGADLVLAVEDGSAQTAGEAENRLGDSGPDA